MATDMMGIAVGWGKINLARAGTSLFCSKVDTPWTAKPARDSARVKSTRFDYERVDPRDPDAGGFGSDSIQHAEGTVLMLRARRTRDTRFIANGIIFLRLRRGAAFISIRHKIPVGRGSNLGDTVTAFHGEADILTVEDMNYLGYRIPAPWLANEMEEDEIAELFEVEVVREAATPKQQLQRIITLDGAKDIPMAPANRRRVRARG